MASNFRVNQRPSFGSFFTDGSFLKKIKPCCGYSLEKGAKIVAILQMTMSGIMAVATLLALIVSVSFDIRTNGETSMEHNSGTMNIKPTTPDGRIFIVIAFIFFVLFVFLHYFLYQGVKQRKYKDVNQWWWMFLLCTALVLLLGILLDTFNPQEKVWGHIEILDFIIDAYCLWIIYEYKKELLEPLDPTVEFERVV